MPNPKDVNPRNFKVTKIIFDNGEFSIAYGCWEGDNGTLAMRWNGEGEEDQGYPKTFGNPMWFIVHGDLKEAFIRGVADVDPRLLLQ